MAVYLSTLKQKFFFLKVACCKEYLLIYSFVRRGISSTAITNVLLDNTQERDHFDDDAFDDVLLILVQITANSIPLKRAMVTLFFISLSKSE